MARRWLEQMETNDLVGKSNYEYALFRLLEGKLLLHKARFSEAAASLEIACARFSEDGRKLESARSRLWLAAAYYQMGKIVPAREMLDQALEAGVSALPHALLISVWQVRRWLEGLQADAEAGYKTRNLLQQAARVAKRLPAARRQVRRLSRSLQAPPSGLFIQHWGRRGLAWPANGSPWPNGKLNRCVIYSSIS